MVAVNRSIFWLQKEMGKVAGAVCVCVRTIGICPKGV